MSAVIEHDTRTELDEFHRWLGKTLAKGTPSFSLDESVSEFLAWRDERDRLREKLRPAIESSLRGEGFPLDGEALKAEVTRRLAAKGIVDEPGQN